MICPTCSGRHGWFWSRREFRRVAKPQPNDAVVWMECPDCVDGTIHCCEGDQAQPESGVSEEG